MKELIKKIVHFLSLRPIIGRPVRILAAIARLPQMYDLVIELNHQNNVVKQQIIEIDNKNNIANLQINQQINEINQQINEFNHLINETRHHQHVFDEEYWPLLVESLNYQENLKKSLPVVLRQYRRSIINKEN